MRNKAFDSSEHLLILRRWVPRKERLFQWQFKRIYGALTVSGEASLRLSFPQFGALEMHDYISYT
jgi:hypothetical protein